MNLVPIGSISEFIRNGLSIKQSDSAGGLPITRIETIANWEVNLDRCGYADLEDGQCNDYLLKKGDILISHINSTKHLGKCALVDIGEEKVIHGMNLLNMRVSSFNAVPDYVFRVLSSDFFKRQLPKITNNSVNQSSFTVTNFKELKIPLPPLQEQKRIAAILDKAEAIRKKRQQAIDLADQFLRSVFLDMFGDPVNELTVAAMLEKGYLLLHKDGNHGGNYPRREEFGQEGVAFISAKDITDEGSIISSSVAYLNEQKARTLKIGWLRDGDVLLAHNATVGRVGLFNKEFPEALIGTSLTAYRPNREKLTSHYLFCALKYSTFQNQLKKNMGQSTRNQVPISAQKELTLPVASMARQTEFKKIFLRIEKQKSALFSAKDAARRSYESLSKAAFEGYLIPTNSVER